MMFSFKDAMMRMAMAATGGFSPSVNFKRGKSKVKETPAPIDRDKKRRKNKLQRKARKNGRRA